MLKRIRPEGKYCWRIDGCMAEDGSSLSPNNECAQCPDLDDMYLYRIPYVKSKPWPKPICDKYHCVLESPDGTNALKCKKCVREKKDGRTERTASKGKEVSAAS